MVQLLERDAELNRLRELVESAARRSGTVALVTGEAGIGKTSLVRALGEELQHNEEVRMLVGGCDDLLANNAFSPLLDIARQTDGGLAQALRGDDPVAVLTAALAQLDTGPATTVMVFEDVHWADDATLDAIRFLARRISDLPALLVLTYRQDEIAEAAGLRRLVGALAGVPLVRFPLQALSRDAVAHMAQAGGGDPRAIYAATGGNPFFVTEILWTGDESVPPTVSDAVLGNIASLEPEAQAVLRSMSVVPGVLERDFAEALFGERFSSLASAEQRGLVEVDREGVSFRHELARRAVESSLSGTERIIFHRKVLEALRARGDIDPGRLLHHAIEAGDEEVILEVGPEAARKAARAGAHREASRYLATVLQHSHRLSPEEHAALLHERAWVVYNLHDFDAALELAEDSARGWQSIGDGVEWGRALLSVGRMQYMVNRPREALATVQRAVDISREDSDEEVLAESLANLGSMQALIDRPQECLETEASVLELAARLGRRDLEVHALNYRGVARLNLGDWDGLADLERSIGTAHEIGAHELAARACTNIIDELVRIGRDDEAERWIDRSWGFLTDLDFVAHRYNLDAQRCVIAMRRGHWAVAEEGLRQLVASFQGTDVLHPFALTPLARLAARRGDPEAGKLIADSWTICERTQALQYRGPAAVARLEWAWLTDASEVEAAMAAARNVLSDAASPGHALLRGELGRYLARAGYASEPDDDIPDRYRAGQDGDWRRAAKLWKERGDPYERALELLDSDNREATLEAFAILDRLGAQAAAELARARLRELGMRRLPRGAQARTRGNPMGLTDRQMEVLELLARGLTNPQIAEELVVSVRTVDHHVSAILGKLGVETRREAAERAGEIGVFPPEDSS